MTCIIFAGGIIEDYKKLYLPKYDYIICADSGLRHIHKLNLEADLILGDFDSSEYIPDGNNVIKFPREKDDTDTMLAVKKAIELNYDEIWIYGGLGGRIDHTIANIQALYYISRHGKKGHLADKNNFITVQLSGSFKYKKYDGFYFSLLSLSDECTGVTLKGVAYPMENGTFSSKFPLGISNEIVDDFAEVSIKSGALLIIYSKD